MDDGTNYRRWYLQIANLPQEVEAFAASGALSEMKNLDLVALSSENLPAVRAFRPMEERTITVIEYAAEDQEAGLPIYLLAKLMIIGMAPLFGIDWENPMGNIPESLIGGAITSLMAFTGIAPMQNSAIIRELRNYSIRLQTRRLLTAQDVNDIVEPILDTFEKMSGIPSVRTNHSAIIVYALAVSIMMGKRLTDSNRQKWFTNRCSALAGALGEDVGARRMVAPPLAGCIAYNSIMSSRKAVRAVLFLMMRNLACLEEGSRYKDLFRVVVNILRYAEMAHISLIIQYILSNKLHLLAMPEISGDEKSALYRAMKYLQKHPAGDGPFVCLLYNEAEGEVLRSKHFKYITAAAQAVARATVPSAKLYKTSYESETANFMKRVTEYVSTIEGLGAVEAAERARRFFAPRTAELLVQRMQRNARTLEDAPPAPEEEAEYFPPGRG